MVIIHSIMRVSFDKTRSKSLCSTFSLSETLSREYVILNELYYLLLKLSYGTGKIYPLYKVQVLSTSVIQTLQLPVWWYLNSVGKIWRSAFLLIRHWICFRVIKASQTNTCMAICQGEKWILVPLKGFIKGYL